MMENIKPMDIEKRSFAIITELLGDTKLEEENELVIKRVIHTTADFDYVQNLVFSPHAVTKGHDRGAGWYGLAVCSDPGGYSAGGIARADA